LKNSRVKFENKEFYYLTKQKIIKNQESSIEAFELLKILIFL